MEEKCAIYFISKRHWLFKSRQVVLHKTAHRASTVIIWSITSFLWVDSTVKLEFCRNQGELRYLKSYIITVLNYRRFYQQRTARVSKHRECQSFIAGSAFLTPCLNQDKMHDVMSFWTTSFFATGTYCESSIMNWTILKSLVSTKASN